MDDKFREWDERVEGEVLATVLQPPQSCRPSGARPEPVSAMSREEVMEGALAAAHGAAQQIAVQLARGAAKDALRSVLPEPKADEHAGEGRHRGGEGGERYDDIAGEMRESLMRRAVEDVVDEDHGPEPGVAAGGNDVLD